MNIRSVCEIPSDFSNKNPRNSEGAFVTLKDGRIAFFYTRYNGEHGGDHDTADIVVRYSADNGETWSDYTVIYRGPAHGNAMSCSSLRLQDGRIMLVFLVKRLIKGMDAETDDVMDCRPFACFSSDECETWTTPACMVRAPGYYVGNNDRLVQLDDGRILYPVAFTTYVNFGAISFVLRSDDGGATWAWSEDWMLPPRGHASRGSGLQEPGVIALPGGTLMCWQRTRYGSQYKAFSVDRGVHWTPPIPATEFLSMGSPLSIRQDPKSGRYLAVWNDTSPRWGIPPASKRWDAPRRRLVVAWSDDGVAWSDPETIEYDDEAGFCYTAIHFMADGHFLLAYCRGGREKGCLNDLRIVKGKVPERQ